MSRELNKVREQAMGTSWERHSMKRESSHCKDHFLSWLRMDKIVLITEIPKEGNEIGEMGRSSGAFFVDSWEEGDQLDVWHFRNE